MLKRLEKTIHEEGLIEPDDRVLCAVSGGSDSVALLVLLKRLSATLPFDLYAAHLDHSLRPESVADQEFVTDLCAALSVPLQSEVVDVQALSLERGEGLEATGRFARRDFFERVAKTLGCQSIALAHHADDQAETVLFRLLRGSGLTGLKAMSPRSGLYIRPLLSCKKVDLCQWLTENGVGWREDASNLDPVFSRNRIRHEILPGLLRINPQVDAALCRFSRQVALEEDFWKEQVERFLARHLIQEQESGALVVPLDALQSVHPALCRRVLRGVLEQLRGDLQQIDAGHIDQVVTMINSPKPQSEVSLPGAWVARRYKLLRMQVEVPVFEPFEQRISGEGRYLLPNGDCLTVMHRSVFESGPDVTEFCAEQIIFPLTVRSIQPGDQFQPSGMAGHKRLKNYFIDNKVPYEIRRQTPVVCMGSTILWVADMRRCEGFWPVNGRPVLQIRLERSVFADE